MNPETKTASTLAPTDTANHPTSPALQTPGKASRPRRRATEHPPIPPFAGMTILIPEQYHFGGESLDLISEEYQAINEVLDRALMYCGRWNPPLVPVFHGTFAVLEKLSLLSRLTSTCKNTKYKNQVKHLIARGFQVEEDRICILANFYSGRHAMFHHQVCVLSDTMRSFRLELEKGLRCEPAVNSSGELLPEKQLL